MLNKFASMVTLKDIKFDGFTVCVFQVCLCRLLTVLLILPYSGMRNSYAGKVEDCNADKRLPVAHADWECSCLRQVVAIPLHRIPDAEPIKKYKLQLRYS